MDLGSATVAQLLVPVADLERAVAYYRDTLGLPYLFSAPPQMAFFQCGAVRLLVGVPTTSAHAARGGTIYFRVADIHAVHASLAARGVGFQVAPHVVHRTAGSELWLAEFQDPDGNQLALLAESPPPSPAPRGS
ncbi:MAG TPA: VOC family protein [Gemmatimonadales bacterium]|nr:VOC family protein [Gemmatimonadales bacterium]